MKKDEIIFVSDNQPENIPNNYEPKTDSEPNTSNKSNTVNESNTENEPDTDHKSNTNNGQTDNSTDADHRPKLSDKTQNSSKQALMAISQIGKVIRLARKYIIIILITLALAVAGYYTYKYLDIAAAPAFYMENLSGGGLTRIIKGKEPEKILGQDHFVKKIVKNPDSKYEYIITDLRDGSGNVKNNCVFYVKNTIMPKLLIKSNDPDTEYELDYNSNFLLEKKRGSQLTNVYKIKKDKIELLFQNVKNFIYTPDGSTAIYIDKKNNLCRYSSGENTIIAGNADQICATDGYSGSFIDMNNRLIRFNGSETEKIHDNVDKVYSSEANPETLYYTVIEDGDYKLYASRPGSEVKLIIDMPVISPCLISDNKGIVFKVSGDILYYYDGTKLNIISDNCLSYKMLNQKTKFKMKNCDNTPESDGLNMILFIGNKLFYFNETEKWMLLDYENRNILDIPYFVDSNSNTLYYILNNILYSRSLTAALSEPQYISPDVDKFFVYDNIYFGYITSDKIYYYTKAGDYMPLKGNLYNTYEYKEGFLACIGTADNRYTGDLYYIVKDREPRLISSDVFFDSLSDMKLGKESGFFTFMKQIIDGDTGFIEYEIYGTDVEKTYKIGDHE